jgi:hypothetical protein
VGEIEDIVDCVDGWGTATKERKLGVRADEKSHCFLAKLGESLF